MFYRKIIISLVLFLVSVAYVNAQNGERAYLYHENGTVAYDSSFQTVYFTNNQAIFNPRFKRYNYKNGNVIYEPSFRNVYYSDGSIACNARFNRVFYQNGNIAYDGKEQIVYDKNGETLIDFSESSQKEYSIKEEHLSITIIPKEGFKYKLEIMEENYIYLTDFETYFKIAQRNTNDDSAGNILRTLKLR